MFFLATQFNFRGKWGSQRGAMSRPGKEMNGRRCFYSPAESLNMCFWRRSHSPAVPLPFSSLIFLCRLLPSAFVQAYFSASSPWTVLIKHIHRHPQGIVATSLFPTSSVAHAYACVSAWASIPRGRRRRSSENSWQLQILLATFLKNFCLCNFF